MDEKLAEILESLKALESDTDLEVAHSEADFLLYRAVILLGRADIAEAFDKVGKWYS